MIIQQQMIPIKSRCFMFLVILLFASVTESWEYRKTAEEVFLSQLIDPVRGEVDEGMAELLWISCRLDFIHLKEHNENLNYFYQEEASFRGSESNSNGRSQAKEHIWKMIQIQHSQLKQTLVDCMRKNSFILPVSGESGSNIPRPTVLKRNLLQNIVEAPSPVGSPFLSPAPSPDLAPSPDSPANPVPPFFPHLGSNESPAQSPPPARKYASPVSSSDSKHKEIVTAVIVTAVVSFAFASLLFFCCTKYCRRGSGKRKNDESPLLTLSLSDSSYGSAYTSYGIKEDSLSKSLSRDKDDSSLDGIKSGWSSLGAAAAAATYNVGSVDKPSTIGLVPPPPGRVLKPPPGRATPLPPEPPASLRPPSKVRPPPPPPPNIPPPPAKAYGIAVPPNIPPPPAKAYGSAVPPNIPPPPAKAYSSPVPRPPGPVPPPPPLMTPSARHAPPPVAPRIKPGQTHVALDAKPVSPPSAPDAKPGTLPVALDAEPGPPPVMHGVKPGSPSHPSPVTPGARQSPPPPPPPPLVTLAPKPGPPPPPVAPAAKSGPPPPPPPVAPAANPPPPPPPMAPGAKSGPPPPPPPVAPGAKSGPPPPPPPVAPGAKSGPSPPPPPVAPGAKPGPPSLPMGSKFPRPPGSKLSSNASGEGNGAPKTKLKPFFWDKVLANPDHSMVWHQIKSGSFQFNEEMIETLFGYTPTDQTKTERKKDSSSQEPTSQFVQILDTKKAQNISILMRALNVTVEEVSDALYEGNELPAELIETLLKMTPTTDEELKLRLFTGEISQLGPAERFLKALIDIPYAYKRLEALLFMSYLQEEVTTTKESFGTLEVACEELRNSRLFLKLLEAVLKTGNRMNDGTFRGGAQAFKLDTLLKLSDVKGTDGKTTLLHFVVQEIIRSEGVRAARARKESHTLSNVSIKTDDLLEDASSDKEEDYQDLGLQVVSHLSSELENVKKAAAIDADILTGVVAKLGNSLLKTKDFLYKEMNTLGEGSEFHEMLEGFVLHAEDDVTYLLEEEKRIMALVKSTGDYFHGKAGKDEGLRLFAIVRDFLIILDKVCREVGEAQKRAKSLRKASSGSSSSQQTPPPDLRSRLFPAIAERQMHYSSSDDES